MNDTIRNFLNRNVLKNLVSLKMLGTYGESIICRFVENGDSVGALLLLPTTVSTYDAQTYPQTRFVVLLSTSDATATRALLPHIPSDCDLVFKLTAAHDRAVIGEQFALRHVKSVRSYTNQPGSHFVLTQDVRISEQLEKKACQIFVERGYRRSEIEELFVNRQALLFELRQNERLVAACFAFRIAETVWEIGGVYTVPDQRRKGHARRLVETALHALINQGFTPRYQVEGDNLPSIQLAEALGLRKFMTIEHWLHDA